MARKHRLAVVASGGSFEQPCHALGGDRTCAIYDTRPRACRAFECVLYTQDRPIAEALAVVARTRALLSRAASLSDAELDELRARMEQDFARARGVP